MKRILIIAAALFSLSVQVRAGQPDSLRLAGNEVEFSDAYLDTVQVRKKAPLNNYSMIGINYGVNFCGQYFNPEFAQKWFFTPGYYSLMFSHYEKLFDYLPYFGFTVGVAYGKEGFQFAIDSKTGEPVRTIRGASKCVVDIAEIPFMIEGHYDADRLRLMMNAGAYAGYRLKIHREGYVEEAIKDNFDATDIRFDYGILAGAGIGYALDPFEFHVRALFRFSWQNMVRPDFLDKYKYYFASPMGVTVQFGVYYQLTRRRGPTNADLRRKARDIVYGEGEGK